MIDSSWEEFVTLRGREETTDATFDAKFNQAHYKFTNYIIINMRGCQIRKQDFFER